MSKKTTFSFFYNNRLRIFLLIIAALLLIVSFLFYNNRVFAVHFVDEEDNMALGSYLLKGEKLYKDLFSHHQPLAYIFSAGIQLFHQNRIYLLIKYHRTALFVYSTLWTLFLVYKFGLPALLFSFLYEPAKILLLGNLFLSESLVVYPLIFVSASILHGEGSQVWGYVFTGFALSLIIFLLAPLWTLTLVLLLILLIKTKNRFKHFVYLLIGALPILWLVFYFSPPGAYIHHTIIINFQSYIPQDSASPSMLNIAKAFFAPFLSFSKLGQNSLSLCLIQLLSLTVITYILIAPKDNQKKFLALVLLGLTNLRFVEPGKEFYQGFHLLPWFAMLSYIGITLALELYKIKKKSWKGKIFLLPIFLSSLLSLNIFASGLFHPQNIEQDLHINFSEQSVFGQAIKIMSGANREETLFTAPDGWLIYRQANINHASKMLNYYAWMTKVPELREHVAAAFTNQSPTYVYCDCGGSLGIFPYLEKYKQIKKEGKKTNLYVLPEKIHKLNEDQINKLEYLGFDIKSARLEKI